MTTELDIEEKEYIYWLIYRKDTIRHISEDIIQKLGLAKLEEYQHDGLIAKWDKITERLKDALGGGIR